jgi:phospholipase B1
MVETLDVRGIESLNTGYVCNTMHGYLCDCGITVANADKLNALVDGFQMKTKELISSGRYDTDDQFTVVLQPFMEQMAPPTLVIYL